MAKNRSALKVPAAVEAETQPIAESEGAPIAAVLPVEDAAPTNEQPSQEEPRPFVVHADAYVARVLQPEWQRKGVPMCTVCGYALVPPQNKPSRQHDVASLPRTICNANPAHTR